MVPHPRYISSDHLLDLFQLGGTVNEGGCTRLHTIFKVKTYHCRVQGKDNLGGKPLDGAQEESKRLAF